MAVTRFWQTSFKSYYANFSYQLHKIVSLFYSWKLNFQVFQLCNRILLFWLKFSYILPGLTFFFFVCSLLDCLSHLDVKFKRSRLQKWRIFLFLGLQSMNSESCLFWVLEVCLSLYMLSSSADVGIILVYISLWFWVERMIWSFDFPNRTLPSIPQNLIFLMLKHQQ